jgi:hypothetical protein
MPIDLLGLGAFWASLRANVLLSYQVNGVFRHVQTLAWRNGSALYLCFWYLQIMQRLP